MSILSGLRSLCIFPMIFLSLPLAFIQHIPSTISLKYLSTCSSDIPLCMACVRVPLLQYSMKRQVFCLRVRSPQKPMMFWWSREERARRVSIQRLEREVDFIVFIATRVSFLCEQPWKTMPYAPLPSCIFSFILQLASKSVHLLIYQRSNCIAIILYYSNLILLESKLIQHSTENSLGRKYVQKIKRKSKYVILYHYYLMKDIHIFVIAIVAALLAQSQAIRSNKTDVLWPLPASYSFETEGQNIVMDPCEINYVIEAPIAQQVRDIINYYLDSVFKCQRGRPAKVVMNIVVEKAVPLLPKETIHESYSILLRTNYRWELIAGYFPGFLRGFETFSQLFETNKNQSLFVRGLPVAIEDQPQFKWRGLLVDTSTHFVPIKDLKKSIDLLMFSKMNIFHWHITDFDSFPIFIPSRPQLSKYGKLSGQYLQQQVKDLIRYAQARGIRVIPQIDTPAHSQSWGRSEKYKQIALLCDDTCEGQLDPTVPLTWEVLEDVYTHMDKTFSDDYAHFGGDQIDYDCWDDNEKISQYMRENNITDAEELSVIFRQRQKKMWREKISKTKKAIYWSNEDVDLPYEDDDVIQWWGYTRNIDQIRGRKNEVILSNYDVTYLDKGFGEKQGDVGDFIYQHWRLMYSFQPRVDSLNVIGGQACMWDELGNEYTQQQKVNLRTSVTGERLWNDGIDLDENLSNIATRLNNHGKRLRSRGFKVSPVTVGLCEEVDMSICFP